MKHNFYYKFILIFSFFYQPVFAVDTDFVNLKSYYYDWMSRKSLKMKQNQAAHDFVLKAIENQNSSALQSNLGITFDLIEKKDDAEKSFLSAIEKASTPEEKFKFHFNLAALYGAQKKIPEALQHYQAALDIVPTSMEAKHNIELLIQQQKQDQKDKEDKEDKEKKDGDKGDSKDNDSKEGDPKDKPEDKDSQKKDEPKDDKEKKPKDQDRKSSPKYKPRPFQGDQLTEGDVKKILGELSQQDQKIRSNFNKKDQQRKEDKNDKDW